MKREWKQSESGINRERAEVSDENNILRTPVYLTLADLQSMHKIGFENILSNTCIS